MKTLKIQLAATAVCLSGPLLANPNNPNENTLRGVKSAYVHTPSPNSPSEATVLLNGPIEAENAGRITNYSLRQVAPRLAPWDGSWAPGGVLEDLDSDGDLDMVLASPVNGEVFAYKNVGTLSAPRYGNERYSLAPAGTASSLAFSNLDGDGDRDMVCGESGGKVSVLYRSTSGSPWPSSGDFGPKTPMLQESESGSPVIISSENYWWTNSSGVPRITFCDMDDDGNSDDMIVGVTTFEGYNRTGKILVFIGTGTFGGSGGAVFAPPVFLQADGESIELLDYYYEAPCPVSHDIDGDGDRDILVSNLAGEVAIYEATGLNEDLLSDNEGLLRFTERGVLVDGFGEVQKLGRVSSMQEVDFSNDGDFDLLVINDDLPSFDGHFMRVMENAGGAWSQFGSPLKIGVSGHEEDLRSLYGSGAVFFDFDADGKVDVLQVDVGALKISINLDTGNRFKPQFSEPIGLAISQQLNSALDVIGITADMADFDGDAKPDPGIDGIVVGTSNDLIFVRYLGVTSAGLPLFGNPESLVPSGTTLPGSLKPSVGDMDSDGKLDVVVAKNDMPVAVLKNTSQNAFTLQPAQDLFVSGDRAYPTFVEVADVDGDHDADLLAIIGYYNGTLHLFQQDAQGSFVDVGDPQLGQQFVNLYSATPRVVNFDGDDGGRPDILMSTFGSTIVPYLSDNDAASPGISLLPAGAALKITSTLPSSAELGGGGRHLALQFPMFASVGSDLELNELRVSSLRCSIEAFQLADYREDLDADGIEDGWENWLEGYIRDHPLEDQDGDGLANQEELEAGSDPFVSDTDGDGLPDGEDPDPLEAESSASSSTFRVLSVLE